MNNQRSNITITSFKKKIISDNEKKNIINFEQNINGQIASTLTYEINNFIDKTIIENLDNPQLVDLFKLTINELKKRGIENVY